MLTALAQATQPDLTTWTPAAVIAVAGAIITGLVTLAAAVAGLIVAMRSNAKAAEAKTESKSTAARQDRQSDRMSAVEGRTFQTAVLVDPKAVPPEKP